MAAECLSVREDCEAQVLPLDRSSGDTNAYEQIGVITQQVRVSEQQHEEVCGITLGHCGDSSRCAGHESAAGEAWKAGQRRSQQYDNNHTGTCSIPQYL